MTSLTYEDSAQYDGGAYVEVGTELLVLLKYNAAYIQHVCVYDGGVCKLSL